MNKPETYLAFRKTIDNLRDTAIAEKDQEMLDGLNYVEEKAKRENVDFYLLVKQILVRTDLE